jgi:hypothetical protein
MLTPEQIRRRCLNRYQDLLRSLNTGESLFPLSIYGSGLPKPRDFVGDRAAIEILRKNSKEQAKCGYAIVWEERNVRRMGVQKIPTKVVFPTQDDYIQYLGKTAEVGQFKIDCELIKQRCPELIEWIRQKPLQVIASAGTWDGLLNVSIYLKQNPRPNCYLRELPVCVDTKFVERHIGILSELLPIVAPMTTGTDKSRFETRFGFRFKQPLVRLRLLDEGLSNRFGFPVIDFATPLDQFCSLPLAGTTILIVENEMTFLSLPPLPDSIALFGAGDGSALLSTVTWLGSCRLFYWGDLDSHGFETLAHLRRTFHHITSVLMDSDTLDRYSEFAVCTNKAQAAVRSELTSEEQDLYRRLAENGLLLEQERIPVHFSKERLLGAISVRTSMAAS